ncbi:MAG: C40 family peptidase, partial [Brooklawnia sp.]|uniref:C40 family peptidase n=1 Tax=Brooklawnia sp. TaxID=2699740 RepID=UPI003C7119C1
APSTSAAAPAPSYASGSAQGAVGFALAQVGKAYAWGATGPDAYDCSGLMVAAYQSVGISLPRTSGAMMSAGYAVSQAELQPGDLIISYGGGHVGMYIGNGQMVHSATYGVGVTVDSISGYSIDAMRRVA